MLKLDTQYYNIEHDIHQNTKKYEPTLSCRVIKCIKMFNPFDKLLLYRIKKKKLKFPVPEWQLNL